VLTLLSRISLISTAPVGFGHFGTILNPWLGVVRIVPVLAIRRLSILGFHPRVHNIKETSMDKHQTHGGGTIGRRNFLKTGALSLAVAASPFGSSASAQEAPAGGTLGALGERWVATWGTGPTGAVIPPAPPPTQFLNQTLRQIVHTSIGGSRIRVRFSNEFGATRLNIGAAHVARRDTASAIMNGTDRALTFGGQASIMIPPGAAALSDPVDLQVPAFVDLAISIFLPEATSATTFHGSAFQTNYVTAGNAAAAATLANATTVTSWFFLTGVSVWAARAGTIVTLGDSITDGASSNLDANHRWPDVLARRLQPFQRVVNLGVVNMGIGGNRLLNPGHATVAPFEGIGPLFGVAALARFDRDVLAQPGVEGAIVLLGVNDLGHPISIAPASEEVTADDLIQGYRQLIARAHQAGIRIYGATMTPFEPTTIPNYFTPAREEKRQTVNTWIRTSGEYDGVIDFDAAVRDPAAPSRMLPAFDSGDHLHPNDAGHVAMGRAVPLNLFRDLFAATDDAGIAAAALA
jgi:lysophospholipase L1-like esterase